MKLYLVKVEIEYLPNDTWSVDLYYSNDLIVSDVFGTYEEALLCVQESPKVIREDKKPS